RPDLTASSCPPSKHSSSTAIPPLLCRPIRCTRAAANLALATAFTKSMSLSAPAPPRPALHATIPPRPSDASFAPRRECASLPARRFQVRRRRRIGNLDVMRVALAQFNPLVGDVAGNSKRIAAFIDRAARQGAGLVVFPELSVM